MKDYFKIKNFIKASAGYVLFLLLIFYILRFTNFDWHVLRSISAGYFWVLSFISVIFLVQNGIGLKLIVGFFKSKIGFIEAFHLSQFFDLLNYLPFKAGMIALGAHLKRNHNLPMNKYAAGTILVYTLNSIIYFIVGGWLVYFYNFSAIFRVVSPLYLSLFIGAVFAFALLYFFLPEFKKDNRYFRYFNFLFQHRGDLVESKKYIFFSALLSLTVLFISALRIDILLKILNYHTPFYVSLMLAVLAGFSFIVAFTPGNLVVREAFLGGLTYLLIGNANIGIVISMFMRVFDLFWLLIFGSYSFFKLKSKISANFTD
ncbi:flippase-like domain-containing protein [Candidatus Wolfebacteria bacterium]|nr:flippase-like domain-containing protein [Candidatus Wolfebacteria bacterium]